MCDILCHWGDHLAFFTWYLGEYSILMMYCSSSIVCYSKLRKPMELLLWERYIKTLWGVLSRPKTTSILPTLCTSNNIRQSSHWYKSIRSGRLPVSSSDLSSPFVVNIGVPIIGLVFNIFLIVSTWRTAHFYAISAKDEGRVSRIKALLRSGMYHNWHLITVVLSVIE